MAKYNLEFKMKLIEEYHKDKHSINYIAKKNGIPSKSILQRWIRLYDEKGVDALRRSRANNSYTEEFKIKIVKEYLTTNVSYLDLALKYGINNGALVARWKLNYVKNGIIGLQSKKKGRPTIMPSDKLIKDDRSKQEKIR